jgi:hypothetical protein
VESKEAYNLLSRTSSSWGFGLGNWLKCYTNNMVCCCLNTIVCSRSLHSDLLSCGTACILREHNKASIEGRITHSCSSNYRSDNTCILSDGVAMIRTFYSTEYVKCS